MVKVGADAPPAPVQYPLSSPLLAGVAAGLVLVRQYDWWALYTGIVSYVLMGLLLGGEWGYRKIVLKL